MDFHLFKINLAAENKNQSALPVYTFIKPVVLRIQKHSCCAAAELKWHLKVNSFSEAALPHLHLLFSSRRRQTLWRLHPLSVLLQTEIWRLTASGKKGTQEKEQNISKKHMKRAAEKASPCKAVAVRHWSLVTWLTWPLCNLCNQATQQFFAIKTALCVLHALPIQIFKALIKSILTYYLQNFKGPLMDWQPVRGAPHLLPKHSWDRLQPVFYVWKNLSRG